jgi:hypothetical protein
VRAGNPGPHSLFAGTGRPAYPAELELSSHRRGRRDGFPGKAQAAREKVCNRCWSAAGSCLFISAFSLLLDEIIEFGRKGLRERHYDELALDLLAQDGVRPS